MPPPERALPVYTVDEPVCMLADRVVAAVTAPPVEHSDLEALLRHLLPPALVPTPPPRPMPTDMEILLKRLLSGVSARRRYRRLTLGLQEMETMLLRLLPGTPVPAAWSRPGPTLRDWIMIVCFSCKLGHGMATGCPELDETFPCMLPRGLAEKVGDNFMMISPRVAAERRRADTVTDPGRGVIRPE